MMDKVMIEEDKKQLQLRRITTFRIGSLYSTVQLYSYAVEASFSCNKHAGQQLRYSNVISFLHSDARSHFTFRILGSESEICW